MRRIIFNADDLGLSRGVNEGILHCYQQGVVNSSSLLTNMAHFEDAVMIIREHKLCNIGLYFNLTEGEPVSKKVSTLTDEKGFFQRNIQYLTNLNMEDVYQELELQYQKAISAGVEIVHIDSHHHIHMTQAFRKIFACFASKHKLPLRKIHFTSRNPLNRLSQIQDLKGVKFYTTHFTADFYGQTVQEEQLIKLVSRFKGKEVEIMCHPGFEDLDNGEYNKSRFLELKILTADRIKSMI